MYYLLLASNTFNNMFYYLIMYYIIKNIKIGHAQLILNLSKVQAEVS